jgi:hypothetical protein
VLSPAYPGFPALAGDQVASFDQFGTRNRYFGVQLGLKENFSCGPFVVDLTGKVAVGDTHEVVHINGGQQVLTPTGPMPPVPGGLLALPTNIGHFHRDQLAFAPEFDVNVGYELCHYCTLFVGYSFLYLSQVARAGDQIDLGIDVNNIPNHVPASPSGQSRPEVTLRETGFWAQGVNFGVEFSW